MSALPTEILSPNAIDSESEVLIFLFTEIRSAPVPIVNVEMKPPRSVLPPYANATVLESTLTRDLYVVADVSCSKLSPPFAVLNPVILPSLSIVNVEMKPSLPPPFPSSYANANVSESTLTRELSSALPVEGVLPE